jgi:WD40 repeat protein
MLLVAACIGGCGGEAGSVEDTSSGGETTASSSGSTVAPDGGSSSSDGGSSSDDASSSDDGTTGGASEASARFIVRTRKGEGELYNPALVTYEGGVLTEPVSLALYPSDDRAVLGATLGVVGAQAHYCVTNVPVALVECFVRLVGGAELGAAQPLTTGLLTPTTVLTTYPTPAAAVGYVSAGAAPEQVDGPSIYFTPMRNHQQLQLPRTLASSTPELRIASAPSVSPDGAWVAYSAQDPQGVALAFMTSTLELPPRIVAVGGAPVAGEATGIVQWLPDSSGIVYGVDHGDVVGYDALYIQAVADDAPPPVRLDDVDDARSKGSLAIAPDGHALTYVATDGTDGSLVFVALSGGLPDAPIVLHDEHTTASWSADSRRLAYAVADASGALDYHVVDALGGAPELMFTVREAMPGAAPRSASFTADQRWLYVVATYDGHGAELYRIDVSGDAPGQPQHVSTALPSGASVKLDYVLSANYARLLYRADATDIGVDELYSVDVAGVTPGEAVRVDVPLREGSRVRGAQISPNGTVATYHEVEHGEPWMLNLVDLEQPGTPILLSLDAMGVVFVDE